MVHVERADLDRLPVHSDELAIAFDGLAPESGWQPSPDVRYAGKGRKRRTASLLKMPNRRAKAELSRLSDR